MNKGISTDAPRTATNICAFTISPVFLFTIGIVKPL